MKPWQNHLGYKALLHITNNDGIIMNKLKLKNTCKLISLRLTSLSSLSASAIALLLLTGAPQQALANSVAPSRVSYDVCIRIADKSDAGTDDPGLKVRLTGANGTTPNEILLDNPGKDDFNRNTWNCFKLGATDAGMADVGHVNSMEWKFSKGDDFCFIQQYVRRNIDGKEVSVSQFPKKGCMGDESYSFQTITLNSQNPMYVVGRPLGKWYSLGSGASTMNASVNSSVSLADSQSKSLSREETNSVTVAIENEAEMLVGDVTTSISGTRSLAVTSASEVVNSHTLNQGESCSGGFENQKNKLGYIWQWGVETFIGNKKLTVKTCHFACTDTLTPPTGPMGSKSAAFCYK